MMDIILKKEIYDGADGTSITEDRCEKYLSLLRMTEQMGCVNSSYTGIQEEADQKKLFPDTKNIPSSIRTIVPILYKMGFVIDYNNKTFPANSFFTKAGKMFVYVLDAIKKNNSLRTPNPYLSQELNRTKTHILQLGLLNMSNTFPENKIWIIIYLMKKIGYVNMNIFYYSLSFLQNNLTIDDAINKLESDVSASYNTYIKEDKKPMENNPFFYRISLLKEMGLVIQETDKNYYLTDDAYAFLNQLRERINPELKNKQFISLLL